MARTYVVSAVLPIPGQFDVNVFLVIGESKTLIGQSPYSIDVVSGLFVLENAVIDGQGVISCGAGVICSFSVFNRDKFSNLIIVPSGTTSILHSCPNRNCNISNGAFNALIELYKSDELVPAPLM
jgi:hypothetical protein